MTFIMALGVTLSLSLILAKFHDHVFYINFACIKKRRLSSE